MHSLSRRSKWLFACTLATTIQFDFRNIEIQSLCTEIMWTVNFVTNFYFLISFGGISHTLMLTSLTMEIDLCAERLTLQSAIIFVKFDENGKKIENKNNYSPHFTLSLVIVNNLLNNFHKFFKSGFLISQMY